MYSMSSQEARSAFVLVQSRLQEISGEASEWRKAMDSMFIVMNEFQLLSTKFQKMLNDISACLPEAFEAQTTLPGLKQQLEKWVMIETSNTSLSKGLEAMVTSQKKLVEMGVQVCTYKIICDVNCTYTINTCTHCSMYMYIHN